MYSYWYPQEWMWASTSRKGPTSRPLLRTTTGWMGKRNSAADVSRLSNCDTSKHMIQTCTCLSA